MRRRLCSGIPLLLLSFFVAFQGRVPITAGSSSDDRDAAERASPSSTLPGGATMFLSAQAFPVGLTPHSVAVGVFIGDDKPDLVTANSGSNNVSVLLAESKF